MNEPGEGFYCKDVEKKTILNPSVSSNIFIFVRYNKNPVISLAHKQLI